MSERSGGLDGSIEYERLWGRGQLAALVDAGLAELSEVLDGRGAARVPGAVGADARSRLLSRFARLPQAPIGSPEQLVRELTGGLFAGAVNWRSRHAQHNVGSAVNAVSAAVAALSLAVNVNMINDDQGSSGSRRHSPALGDGRTGMGTRRFRSSVVRN